jgi:hypothetical protein
MVAARHDPAAIAVVEREGEDRRRVLRLVGSRVATVVATVAGRRAATEECGNCDDRGRMTKHLDPPFAG